jgi:transposase
VDPPQAYPAEPAEAFCDGHVAAFDSRESDPGKGSRRVVEGFGGVPQSILYDNTKLAVARIVKGG